MSPGPVPAGPAGLLHRLRRAPIAVADLRRVAERTLPALCTAQLEMAIVDHRSDGPVLVLEEDERRLRIPLGDLAEDLGDARVGGTPAEIAAALSSWVAARPVPDRAAAVHGVAVLDWRDRTRTSVGWRVVVRRGDRALPWVPSTGLGRDVVERTRAAAVERAARVPGELRVEGPVALWSHPEVPVLASAVLVRPERLLARIAAIGMETTGLHAVVTPHRPLACATGPVTARLAGETGEPCARLPWRELAGLSWV